jgi:lipoprotein signal peptidase
LILTGALGNIIDSVFYGVHREQRNGFRYGNIR